MKIRFLPLIVALLSCASASADTSPTNVPFALPVGAKIVARDDSGKTWRQSGLMRGTVSETQQAFSNALVRSRFMCRHGIALDEKSDRSLWVWKKGDMTLMLLLWPTENGQSMFSWGTFRE